MFGYIRKDLLTVDGKTTEIKEEPEKNETNEEKPSENKPTTGQDTPLENEIPTNGEVVNEGTTGETSSENTEVKNEDKKIGTIKVVEVDIRSEKIGYKIREAQLEKIPYMFIVGDKEKEEGLVSVRSRKAGDLGAKNLDDVIAELAKENDSKRI